MFLLCSLFFFVWLEVYSCTSIEVMCFQRNCFQEILKVIVWITIVFTSLNYNMIGATNNCDDLFYSPSLVFWVKVYTDIIFQPGSRVKTLVCRQDSYPGCCPMETEELYTIWSFSSIDTVEGYKSTITWAHFIVAQPIIILQHLCWSHDLKLY